GGWTIREVGDVDLGCALAGRIAGKGRAKGCRADEYRDRSRRGRRARITDLVLKLRDAFESTGKASDADRAVGVDGGRADEGLLGDGDGERIAVRILRLRQHGDAVESGAVRLDRLITGRRRMIHMDGDGDRAGGAVAARVRE